MPDPVVLAFEDRRYRRSGAGRRGQRVLGGSRARECGPATIGGIDVVEPARFVIALYGIWRAGGRRGVELVVKRAEPSTRWHSTAPTYAVGDQPLLAELCPCSASMIPIPPRSTRWGQCRPRRRRGFRLQAPGPQACPRPSATHASFAAAVAWGQALQLRATDRLQIATPPSHILGLLNIATVLDRGGYLQLHRRFDIDTLLRHRVRPHHRRDGRGAIALAIASHPDLGSFDLSSLRYIMWCATPVTPASPRPSPARRGHLDDRLRCQRTTRTGVQRPPRRGRLDTVRARAPQLHLRVVSPGDR